MSTPRIQIWGSCVSRDMWPQADNRLDLVGYVARQSALSEGNSVSTPAGVHGIESYFQSRMLSGDVQGDALDRVIETNPDAVLIDLVDERLGVYSIPGGAVTKSAELVDSNWYPYFRGIGRFIQFGTDEHFERWSDSFATSVEELRAYLPEARVLLIEAPFALEDTHGQMAPTSLTHSSKWWNSSYGRYYAYAKTIVTDVVRIPDEYAVTDPDHQWGPAPFHYIPEAYESMIGQIERILKENPTHDA